MPTPIRIRLATRGSLLAQWQANWIAAQLKGLGAEVVLVPIVTSGDRNQEGAIGGLGERGVFTKEIQRALLDGRADLAVHSLKDVPTDRVDGLTLAAVPERAPVSDVLVSRDYAALVDLPSGAVVGTGSLRRRAQLFHVRRDLAMRDIRGNVDTRLRKLDRGEYDAIVLAEAGLRRLGLEQHITQILPASIVLPAPGQGALGLETRSDDRVIRQLLEALDHPATRAAVLAERAMLAALGGGCLAPIAAWARIEDGRLLLTGRVLSLDGTRRLEESLPGQPTAPEPLGRQVAESLLAQGAKELIDAARK